MQDFFFFFSIIDFTCEPERLLGLSTDKLLKEQEGEKKKLYQDVEASWITEMHTNTRRRHVALAYEKSEI